MLNKDMLQFTRNSGRINIRFLKYDRINLNIAEALLDIYRSACSGKLSRAGLEEKLEPFLKAALQGKAAAGMNKIIIDHCEFTPQRVDCDPAALRENLFKCAASVLADPPESVTDYRRIVQKYMGADKEIFAGDIYGDLPEFDRLTAIPDWNSETLIDVYNVSLVQSLLLYAESLELFLADPDPMTLRKFMRRLKFFRLLADVEKISTHEVKLTVSGPAAIFGENRKYGLQLAAFFQVVLLMKEWKMRSKLRLSNDKVEILNLSNKNCDLKSSVRRWATYVPEEVTLFIRQFRAQVKHWREAPEADLPRISGKGVVFPDFSFESTVCPGKVVHVELFHRYYSNALEDHLQFLQENPNYPMVIGIDRFLLGKGGEKDFIERYSAVKEHIFFYSNYPGVEKVCRALDKVVLRDK